MFWTPPILSSMWCPNDDSYSQKRTFNDQVQVADDYLNEGYWEVVAGLITIHQLCHLVDTDIGHCLLEPN